MSGDWLRSVFLSGRVWERYISARALYYSDYSVGCCVPYWYGGLCYVKVLPCGMRVYLR